jgi:hypothetical protein
MWTNSGRPECRWSLRVQGQLIDAPVPGLSELDAQAPELEVGVQVPGDSRRVEVVEGHEEPDGFVVGADEVLQQEEANVAPEVLEQGKEAGVPPRSEASGLSSCR